MKLSVKLPLLVVGAVTVATVVGGGIAVAKSEQLLRQQAIDADDHSLAAYASALTSYLKSATSVLAVVARDSEVVDYQAGGPRDPALHGVSAAAAGPQRADVRNVLASSDAFEYVALLDRDCTVYLAEPYGSQTAMARDDWSFMAWCRDVVATGRAVISDLHISPVTQFPSVVLAVPVTNAAGATIGALAGALRLDTLSSLAEAKIAGNASGASYGFVTDRRGLVIAHHGNPDYVRSQTDFSSIPAVAKALTGAAGTGAWCNPIDKQDMLGAYLQLPVSGWPVVYSTPTSAALAPAYRLATSVEIASLGVLVLLGSACIVIARRIVRPLARLSDAADQAAGGDLTPQLGVAGHDEVAGLARRFAAMLASLAEKESELRARAAALEQSNGEMESFTYSVSHDLRAPLRSIDGFSQILLEDYAGALDETGRAHLGRVRAATQRMGSLIDDLLALSRIGRADIRREPLDLSLIADDVVRDLRAADPGREVAVTVAPGLAADGDAALVRVALANLLGNAWKFTARTEGARIDFAASEAAPGCFAVRDNGAGFDMAYADKLFGAFQRLHAAADFPGTGVGLATVRRVVGRHGGRVWAEAEVGRGATFTFSLSPDPGRPPDAAAPQPQEAMA